ncbi:MAG: hypothetical protein C5B54_07820 [Acidobacteria bacterium]|nr:MAG: hypothetical protein C5B54_07820 [Acidobacteriota bacterium]
MIQSRNQLYFMGLILAVLIVVYCLPFEQNLVVTSAIFIILFPVQMVLWRLSFGRKAKDFFFCFSLLIVSAILKHYWHQFDTIFYLLSILMAAVLRYRILFAIAASGFTLEAFREYYYGYESPEEVAFRYVLFFAAGSIVYLLLWEEKRKKEGFKKELDDLKYGMNQLDEEPVVALSDSGQISRKVDAALALDEALKHILQSIHSIFKPDTVLLWQYLPEKQQLRIRDQIGNIQDLKENLIVEMGEGPVGWSALNQKAFLQQNKEEGIPFSIYRKNQVIRSFLAVPVLDGNRLEGVLTLDSSHQNYFAADSETMVGSFATQISETIRMARLAKEREERAFEFQAFYHASRELSAMIDFDEIIRKLHLLSAEIVHSDFSAIVMLQLDATQYSVFEWNPQEKSSKMLAELRNDGRTWISWFLSNREEPLIISTSQLELQEMPLLSEEQRIPGMATFLAIPMRHQQKSIGAMLLGAKVKDAFSSYEARILSILCNQAAVSLENASIIKKMEELAITDGLTGLFNHRFLQEALDKEFDRSERQKTPFSLLIMDIDHFKGFNDSFGHPAGDFVLKSLANLLKASARKIDILARYGGEEFAALLPGIDQKNARKTAERWRKSVQRASFKWETKSFAITLSIGFATFPIDANTKGDLIDKADRALYAAKEKGRNQVRHCTEAEMARG